jgi:hypothetical protein
MRRSRAEWAQIIEQFEHSGQSHEGFCGEERLNVGSFRGWLYRLRREAVRGKVARSATRLLPVRVAAVEAIRDERFVEVVVGGAVVRVPGGFDPAYVAELVAQLRDRC